MVASILMLIGFVLLIKGADLLVDGSSALARRIGISDLTIGLTVVGFGTSTPELVVNILAGIQGTTGLAIGNFGHFAPRTGDINCCSAQRQC